METVGSEKVLFDLDYEGNITQEGAIRELWGEEALNQSIKLWIASNLCDIIREPNRGGYITRYLCKPMREVDVEDIKMGIRDGIYQDFEPHLVINDLRIEPDYANRRWKFYMEVYSQNLKTKTTVEEYIKALT